MRILAGLAIVALLAQAASGATITVCPSGCTYTGAQLQTALDALACSDILEIDPGTYSGNYTVEGKGCTAGTQITVTSRKGTDWLPADGVRITPSHQANLPVLSGTAINTPTLSADKDVTHGPPSHWRFVAVGFTVANSGTTTSACTGGTLSNAIIHLGGEAVNYTATSSSDYPDGVILDRVFVFGPTDNAMCIKDAVRLNTRAGTVKNSFIRDIWSSGVESHGVASFNSVGPWTITNNFFHVASIPIFSGGAQADFLSPQPVLTNVTVEHNSTYKSWKWWDSATYNPYQSDFTGNGSRPTPCMKNHGEFKGVDTLIWRYNHHENQMEGCQSQSYGFAFTPRANLDDTNAGTLTISGDPAINFAWTGSSTTAPAVGMTICASISSVWHCKLIATVDTGAKTGTANEAWASTGSGLTWFWGVDPDVRVRNVTMTSNVFRNVGSAVNWLGRDTSGKTSASDAAGVVSAAVVKGNLFYNTLQLGASAPTFFRFVHTEREFADNGTAGANSRSIEFSNNTFDPGPGGNHSVALFASDTATAAKISTFTFSNNLSPSGSFGLFGGSWGSGGTAIDSLTEGTVNVLHNTVHGQAINCTGGRTCSGNFNAGSFTPAYAGSSRGIYKLTAASDYARAGADGRDLGADFDALPLIKNLVVRTTSTSALMEFDLSASNKDVPVVLEVSTSENLRSMLGTYTPINSLNPVRFKRPDVSTRTNAKLLSVIVSGTHVSWPVCWDESVTDDAGTVGTSLACAANTTYYYRLMAGGETKWGSFTTAAVASSATDARMQFAPPAGVVTVRINYGSTSALGSTANQTVAGGLATHTIPVTAEQPLYYQRLHLDGGGATLWTGPVEIHLP